MLLFLTFILMALSVHAAKSNELIIRHVTAMTGLDLKRLEGVWWYFKTLDNFSIRGPLEHVSCPVLKFEYKRPNTFNVFEDYIPNPQNPTEHTRLKWNLEEDSGIRYVGNMIANRFRVDLGLVKYNFDVVSTDYTVFLYAHTVISYDNPMPLVGSQRRGGIVFTRQKALAEDEIKYVEYKVNKAIIDSDYEIISYMSTNINNTNCQDVKFPETF